MKLLVVLLLIIFLYLLYCILSPKGYSSSGSGGLSPEGGMRNAVMEQASLKYPPIEYNDLEPYIYDNYQIPDPMIWKVGHWSE